MKNKSQTLLTPGHIRYPVSPFKIYSPHPSGPNCDPVSSSAIQTLDYTWRLKSYFRLYFQRVQLMIQAAAQPYFLGFKFLFNLTKFT